MVVQTSCEVGREEGGLGSLVREKGKGNVKQTTAKVSQLSSPVTVLGSSSAGTRRQLAAR